MKKIFYLMTIILLFFSCKKNDTVINYYENGNLKEKSTKIGDTVTFEEYYQNGYLKIEGKLFKDKPVGVWKRYNEENKSLKEISEFIIDEEKSFKNQQIFFNNDKTIDYSKSIFYQIINDTLRYHSPLDTLNSKLQRNREIKLISYYNGKEKEVSFKEKVAIRGYSFPVFILESVSIELDSMVDGESLTRLINRQLLVTRKNIYK